VHRFFFALLCVQGLAVRGHSEDLGNFENLLKLRATDNAALKSWLEKSGYRWLSPAIQNEIIQDLALSVLRYFKQHMMDSKYFAIVMDETTDASCKEQVSVCLRYVFGELQVHEIFTGFMKRLTRLPVLCLKLPRMYLLDLNCRL
jgi:hypothetical protein